MTTVGMGAGIRNLLGGFLLLIGLVAGNPDSAWAQAKTYTWRDIDCPTSRLVTWRGLTCRGTGVVTNESRIGAFRQWAAFGSGPAGYYVHMFLWEAVNGFSYLSGDDTTADFVKWMFENGKSIGHVSTVQRAVDADYVTFTDERMARHCVGFRRLGDFRRSGYDSVTGGILCAPPGTALTTDDIELFIENVRLQPAG